MYLSEILSSFICGKPDFDPQVRYLAKRSIVDTMGAMLAGSCTDVVKQLLPVYNAPGCCTLVGLKGAVSANNAAFLNGISGTSWSWTTRRRPTSVTPRWPCCPVCWPRARSGRPPARRC